MLRSSTGGRSWCGGVRSGPTRPAPTMSSARRTSRRCTPVGWDSTVPPRPGSPPPRPGWGADSRLRTGSSWPSPTAGGTRAGSSTCSAGRTGRGGTRTSSGSVSCSERAWTRIPRRSCGCRRGCGRGRCRWPWNPTSRRSCWTRAMSTRRASGRCTAIRAGRVARRNGSRPSGSSCRRCIVSSTVCGRAGIRSGRSSMPRHGNWTRHWRRPDGRRWMGNTSGRKRNSPGRTTMDGQGPRYCTHRSFDCAATPTASTSRRPPSTRSTPRSSCPRWRAYRCETTGTTRSGTCTCGPCPGRPARRRMNCWAGCVT
ncbi:hypothetical protein ABIA38_002733 [Embleya sp. AB8]